MATKNDDRSGHSDETNVGGDSLNVSQETSTTGSTQTDVAMETDSNASSDVAQSGDMDGSFASYVSDSSTVNTSTGSSANTSTSTISRGPHRPGIQWKKGEKIEAMDSFHKWYAAKFADVDFEERLVLIHFEGWNQRYDEWIPFNSERLRPMTRHSGRKEGKRKQKREHRPGERVLAKWTDCKMYPAKVTDVKGDGSLEVVFYDGFKRIVQPINVRAIPQEYKRIVKSKFKKMERKGPPAGRSDGDKKHHKAEIRSRSSSRDGKEENVPCPTPKSKAVKDIKAIKKRHSTLMKRRKLAMTKTLASHRSTGRKRVLKEMKKAEHRRKVQQKGFPKKRDRIPKKSLPAPSSSDGEKPAAHSTVKHILHSKGESRAKKRSVSLPSTMVKPSFPIPASPPSATVSSKPQAEGPLSAPCVVASKAFKIEEDHNLYKCTHDGCAKSFRKEKLLESHVKYYHLDDSKAAHTPGQRAKRRKTVSICSTDSDHSVASAGKGTSTPNDPSPSVSPAKRRHISADGFPFNTESPVNFASPKETQTPHEMSPLTHPPIKEEPPHPPPTSTVPASATLDKKPRSSTDGGTGGVPRDTRTSLGKDGKHSRSSIDSNVTESSVVETEDEEDGNEVVNCVCGFYETDGLMIQCDICLCWQHALCLNLDKDSVPTNYICFICENPPGYREGSRNLHNQEWLKTGHLPPFSFLTLSQSEESRETGQAVHSLVGDLHNISAVLHSLHQQIKASQDPNNPEFSLWHRDWDDTDTSADTTEEFHSVSVEESPLSTTPVDIPDPPCSTETPPVRFSLDLEQASDLSVQQPKFQLPMATESLTQSLDNIDTASEASTMTASESSTSLMCSVPSGSNLLADGAGDVRAADSVVPSSDGNAVNKKEKLNLQISTAPQKPVDRESMLKACERNLLLHVLKVQNEVNQRLDLIEEQVSVLEKSEGAEPTSESPDPLQDVAALKQSLHLLMRDLYKVKRMAAYH